MLGKTEIDKSLFAFYVIVEMDLVKHFLTIGLPELRALRVPNFSDRNSESSSERLIVASNFFLKTILKPKNFCTFKDFIVVDAFW